MHSAIQKALNFLVTQQQNDGGFVAHSSPTQTPFAPQYTYHTTFASALILSAMRQISLPAAQQIRQGLAQFLMRQKSSQWSFNYWDRNSAEAQAMPYPDDLDDTFCALSSLWLHDSTIVDQTALAQIVKILLATETTVGGPYRTWLATSDSGTDWKDVDLAVNANIAYFLRLAVDPLPNLTAFMEKAIAQQAFDSPYYPHEFPVLYYLSRAYRGPQQTTLIAAIRARQLPNGSWGTPLQTALAICSLRNLGQPIPPAAARFLCRAQQTDGSWPAEAFCLDPKRDGVAFYSGSAALTTAFATEALYQNTVPTRQTIAKRSQQNPIFVAVSQQITQDLTSLHPTLRKTLRPVVKHTLHGKNGHEIVLLPAHFANSLRDNPNNITQICQNMGAANLYGWIAYTMYDDILDNEAEPELLSAANVAMRRSFAGWHDALPQNTAFHHYVRTMFDRIDTANAHELQTCRFAVTSTAIRIGALPAYKKLNMLAERSIGHALGPMGILAAAGILPTTPAGQAVHTAFFHYLIARQLNDDLHDWQEDLKAGRITYVVAQVLRALNLPPGVHEFSTFMPQAQQQFWHRTLLQVTALSLRHIQKSRQALVDSQLLEPQNVLTELLDTLEDAARRTKTATAEAEQFLAAYRKP